MPPTGKVITVTEMTFDRFADGKLVEDYAEADLAGLMQQLGAIAAFEWFLLISTGVAADYTPDLSAENDRGLVGLRTSPPVWRCVEAEEGSDSNAAAVTLSHGRRSVTGSGGPVSSFGAGVSATQ
jgi:hypothetical protein